mmetsp:Transcript_22226/g.48812  ORF Transcript_22226/g.48812 Transcript_22226/m.48812 type:complete len:427 (-) Transcript_22226:243-1523(-)|eukprot:CAMPEP_0118933326 /NCGR_PEP_ID=MMETSP1169-20130426/11927_1 /TAXON_ID=36882 /ORGANISM="Pyramimonas obovata, Strain CCMP722" /LENGTH=426 /DNA_ID=CAMNT_0006876075 /DNA_START=207 /DNA_END=1487 /DNA_ORIENTATION=+
MMGMAGIYHKGIAKDTHHKGCGQAGNKSMISYRPDMGIPGYTGFIPGYAVINLPTKGTTIHTGRPANDAEIKEVAGEQGVITNESEYSSTFLAKPKDYFPSRTEGGQWQAPRFGEVVTDARFNDGSTYVQDMLCSKETHNKSAKVAEGLATTLYDSTQAQQRLKAGTHGQEKEGQVGYKSVYADMIVKEHLTGGKFYGKNSAPPTSALPPGTKEREKVVKRCIEPNFYSKSTYADHFGTFGSNPLEKAPTYPAEQKKLVSTRDLNEGTAKASEGHIPLYSGFIPQTQHNEMAVKHGNLSEERVMAKPGMLLCSLDQFPRFQLPKYGGTRARSVHNMKTEAPQPPLNTAYGRVNAKTWKDPLEPLDHRFCLNGKKGVEGFFTAGANAVSDNGRAAAQCFYHVVRPNEGLPRVLFPSQTTVWGSKFPY